MWARAGDDGPDQIEAASDRDGRRNEKRTERDDDTDGDSCDDCCGLKVLDKIDKSSDRHRGGHKRRDQIFGNRCCEPFLQGEAPPFEQPGPGRLGEERPSKRERLNRLARQPDRERITIRKQAWSQHAGAQCERPRGVMCGIQRQDKDGMPTDTAK
jgi:hypothetical protein